MYSWRSCRHFTTSSPIQNTGHVYSSRRWWRPDIWGENLVEASIYILGQGHIRDFRSRQQGGDPLPDDGVGTLRIDLARVFGQNGPVPPDQIQRSTCSAMERASST